MKHLYRRSCLFVCMLALVGSAAACGGAGDPSQKGWSVSKSSGDETGYDQNATVVSVSSTEDDYVVEGDPDGCVEIEGQCIDTAKAKRASSGPYCNRPDARADAVVEDGEVVEVVCYPPKSEANRTVVDESGDVNIAQQSNGSVVTFDASTNGEPIERNVKVEAERTTIYGNGVDKTTVQENVTVASNQSRLRSMTVRGNVTYQQNANESALAFCKIEGNLTVKANGFTAVDCRVFGDVDIRGNEASLRNIGVEGSWNVSANAECTGCYGFSDANDNATLDDGEKGDALTCGGSSGGDGDDTGGGPPGGNGPPGK